MSTLPIVAATSSATGGGTVATLIAMSTLSSAFASIAGFATGTGGGGLAAGTFGTDCGTGFAVGTFGTDCGTGFAAGTFGADCGTGFAAGTFGADSGTGFAAATFGADSGAFTLLEKRVHFVQSDRRHEGHLLKLPSLVFETPRALGRHRETFVKPAWHRPSACGAGRSATIEVEMA